MKQATWWFISAAYLTHLQATMARAGEGVVTHLNRSLGVDEEEWCVQRIRALVAPARHEQVAKGEKEVADLGQHLLVKPFLAIVVAP
jgi:hypothetical protein